MNYYSPSKNKMYVYYDRYYVGWSYSEDLQAVDKLPADAIRLPFALCSREQYAAVETEYNDLVKWLQDKSFTVSCNKTYLPAHIEYNIEARISVGPDVFQLTYNMHEFHGAGSSGKIRHMQNDRFCDIEDFMAFLAAPVPAVNP